MEYSKIWVNQELYLKPRHRSSQSKTKVAKGTTNTHNMKRRVKNRRSYRSISPDHSYRSIRFNPKNGHKSWTETINYIADNLDYDKVKEHMTDIQNIISQISGIIDKFYQWQIQKQTHNSPPNVYPNNHYSVLPNGMKPPIANAIPREKRY